MKATSSLARGGIYRALRRSCPGWGFETRRESQTSSLDVSMARSRTFPRTCKLSTASDALRMEWQCMRVGYYWCVTRQARTAADTYSIWVQGYRNRAVSQGTAKHPTEGTRTLL